MTQNRYETFWWKSPCAGNIRSTLAVSIPRSITWFWNNSKGHLKRTMFDTLAASDSLVIVYCPTGWEKPPGSGYADRCSGLEEGCSTSRSSYWGGNRKPRPIKMISHWPIREFFLREVFTSVKKFTCFHVREEEGEEKINKCDGKGKV